jgi:hypothetical protein
MPTQKEFGMKIIQFEDLLPGDILLYRPLTPDALQQRVSVALNSPYTHAAVYLGDNKIAESVMPIGVVINGARSSLDGSLCAAVMRTQLGFLNDRTIKLRKFVEEVIKNGRPFHRYALANFAESSIEFFDNQLSIVAENYGRSSTIEQLTAKSFFCSGFVVACFQAVGIIDSSAQVAYPPEFYSPAHLYADATFGWLLGFLLPKGNSVPEDDPIQTQATNWTGMDELRWW